MRKLSYILCGLLFVGCSGSAETTSLVSSPSPALLETLPDLSGDMVWTTDYTQSELQFQAIHAGATFTGGFSSFATAIKLDPLNPSDGEIYVSIDMSSFDAKDDDRNANLPDAAWFNIKSFPFAEYKSQDIRRVEGNEFTADGTLSIKGISKSVTLNFTLDIEGDNASAKGVTVLMRPDYKLGTETSDFATEEWVGFPVKVMFSIAATR